MPLITAPNLIELSDFTAGWAADLEPAAVAPNGLLDVLNVLPDAGAGTLRTRKGFLELAASLDGTDYTIGTVVSYGRLQGTTTGRFLMVVTGTGTNGIDHVHVYAVDLSDGSFTQVSPNTKNWNSGDPAHYGVVIGGTYYGGGPEDQMYSWNPDDGWDDDPTLQDFPLMVDVLTGTFLSDELADPPPPEVPKTWAFPVGYKVRYTNPLGDTKAYSVSVSNDADAWVTDHNYKKGDLVTRRTDWDLNTFEYKRCWEASKNHRSNGDRMPGTHPGGTPTDPDPLPIDYFWTEHNLSLPTDSEGNISSDWDLIPEAAVTNVSMWFAERLWLRYDNLLPAIAKLRAQYSAPSKPKQDSDIGEVTWDPRDFSIAPPDDVEGDGGGWLPDFPAPIVAMKAYGYYGLFFMRNRTKVLSGTNESTWVLRDLANVGAVGRLACAEHEGLVYFVSDRGLYVTDGSNVREADGAGVVRDFIRSRIDTEVAAGEDAKVFLWSFDGYVWVAFASGTPVTLVYDPRTRTVWKTDLPVGAGDVAAADSSDRFYFTKPGTAEHRVFEYGGTDDDGTDIPWLVRTAWFPFGVLREDRRIRRVWALVSGACTFGLRAFRNYSETPAFATTGTVTDTAHIEGLRMTDSYAVSMEVSGSAAPASVLGVSMDTQPRRVRYHVP